MLSLVERTFVRKGSALRADGRARGEGRAVQLVKSRNPVSGQANCEAKLGETLVLACVTAAVMAPFPDRPNEGVLKVNVVMAGGLALQGGDEGDAVESGGAALGNGKQAAQQRSSRVTAILEHCLLETRAVDLEGLCIVAGRKVWSVRVDVSILNDAGSAVDAAALAALGALSHFRRPDVTVVGETVNVYSLEEREPVPLALHHTPLCVTFSLFHQQGEDSDMSSEKDGNDDGYYLLDPTDREELSHDGQVTVIINSHKEVCGIYKQGWPPLASDKIAHLVKFAAERSLELAKLLVSK